MNANLNAAPCFNTLRGEWNDAPNALPAGPIEIYAPTEDGTENLPADANVEVEFFDVFPTLEDAIRSLPHQGRFFWSTPDASRYLGFLNADSASVAFVSY